MSSENNFYLGRIFDIQQGQTTRELLYYEPEDLTTHAVVVGMTGSGKTGLCLALLEEAALQGIPALMIDPKGDITNALLHFPDLLPQDFRPWVNPDEARRAGQSLDQAAAAAAQSWRAGLSEWDIPPERIRLLKEAVNFAAFTPGSDAGLPVSILASLKAPGIEWESNRELLREKISGTVTALLGLVGLTNIDPVRSREHILLANIFENAWKAGRDLDLGELILQTQTPPFTKLGVFDVNSFFPEKDRFGLAMMLNNILAAPAFQSWVEGQPLDIPSLLWGADGRPRHSLFYIAHLNEEERMFFVTLLYSAVESWMRAQGGTSSLRALVYFDEIFGYLPPISSPPSKPVMLRMLKQARAFGVGQLLVTQNPVDVDYKALSNAGTWFIGKLQTDQDKQRLLDGLEGAAPGLDRGQYDRLISGLRKRLFLLHNVHSARPQVFQTRWVMNFMAGPLTRVQLPALNALVGARFSAAEAGLKPAGEDLRTAVIEPVQPPAAPALQQATDAAGPPSRASALPGEFFTSRPTAPAGVQVYVLPNNMTFTQALKNAGQLSLEQASRQGLVYRPVVLAQAAIRLLNRKYNLDTDLRRTAVVRRADRRGMVRWEEWISPPLDRGQLETVPDPEGVFAPLEAPFSDAKVLAAMQKDFLDWAYRSTQVTVRANEALKVYAGPETSSAQFRQMTAEAARLGRDAEARKVSDGYDRKLEGLKARLEKERRELGEDEDELSQRKMEEWGTHAENLFGLFGGRKSSRRLSSSLSKRRMTGRAKADVEESRQQIRTLEVDIAALEAEKERVLKEVTERWGQMANEASEIAVTPFRKDVYTDLFGVAWMPFYRVQTGREVIELPGFSAEVG